MQVKEAERAPQEVLILADDLAVDAVADDLAALEGSSQFDTIATQLRPSPTEDSLRSRRVARIEWLQRAGIREGAARTPALPDASL
jgi:hypothetical protein